MAEKVIAQRLAARQENSQPAQRATEPHQAHGADHTRMPAAFVDNRPEAVAQRQLIDMIRNSPQAADMRAMSEMMNNSPRVVAQRKMAELMNNSPRAAELRAWSAIMNGNGGTVAQSKTLEATDAETQEHVLPTQLQLQSAPSVLQNNTGLPDKLKSGIEALSGISMDHVKVHYNSSQPAQLHALAYAQGTDIHVAPGQEQHLPHEAWHLVQQAEGRVQAESEGERFEAGGEVHTLWVEHVNDQPVVVVASEPMTVPQRLRQWSKAAAKMSDSALKTNILAWIEKCWAKNNELLAASSIEDHKERAGKIHSTAAALKELLKPLFWAFKIDLPELGAQALYRGLHFSKDWMTQRGRTVAQEGQRSFESVKADGTYSGATWELAKGLAGSKPVTSTYLESANLIVQGILEKWKGTSNFNRKDNAEDTEKMAAAMKDCLAANQVELSRKLQAILENRKRVFSQSGNEFENLFMAALSRYINNQKLFETEMANKQKGYEELPFKAIPFISTTKDAGEAVKYAQGKLAGAKKSDTGVVGRVLIYVASRIDMLEAGGIDVWQELGAGRLRFTTWRMAENEITFAGKIPDHFLRAMTPVRAEGEETVPQGAVRAEIAAAKTAAPFGGLKPLPKNEPHV